MIKNTINNYLDWISPKPFDPTYSVLKAHLLLEDLIRAYLAKTLPNPGALKNARLTFSQLVAVARSCCVQVGSEHWMWKAIADLNKIRNMLSHEVAPKDLSEKIHEYANFIVAQNKVPFPNTGNVSEGYDVTDRPDVFSVSSEKNQQLFRIVDLATLGLYIEAAANFGFDVQAFVKAESTKEEEISAAFTSNGSS